MAGVAALILKIMPLSLDVSLKEIQAKAQVSLERAGAMNISFNTREIAFGLKALIIKLAWPESNDTDKAENAVSSIEGVSSVTIEDYRRAFG